MKGNLLTTAPVNTPAWPLTLAVDRAHLHQLIQALWDSKTTFSDLWRH